MKRKTMLSAAIATALLSSPVLAQDNDESDRFYVGPRIGVMGTDSDRVAVEGNALHTFGGGLDTWMGGLEAGFHFTPEWGTRVYYDYLRGDLETTSAFDSSGHAYGVDVLYNFTKNFYGAVGVNSTELGNLNNRFLRLTAGYKEFLNENLAISFEGAVQQNDGDLTEFMFMTGLRWYFGGSDQPVAPKPRPQPAPVVAPVVVDTDGDGVPDNRDKCPNTQAGFKVDADGCVMYANEVITRELLVTFPLNSADIPESQKSDIRDTANFLKEYPQLDVTIEGHTDDTGQGTYNQALSEWRAQAVGDSLVKDFGIAAERVRTVGYGETKPKYPNNSSENRAKNRRIEAKMSVTKKVPVKN